MVAFSKIKPGDLLYEVKSERCGNTTMRRQAVRTVRIIEVGDGWAIASWNSNAPKKFYRRYLESLRRSKPAPKESGIDRAFRVLRTASGIEAAEADETRSGSAEGESPVSAAETPNPDPQNTPDPTPLSGKD